MAAIDYSSMFAPGAMPPSPYPYNYAPDWSQGDPSQAQREDRAYFSNWNENSARDLASQQAYQRQLAQMYGGAMDTAGAKLGDNPGWTPQEKSDIINPDAWKSGMTGPEGFASLNPTAAETSGMTGDPSKYSFYFDPVTQAMPQNISTASASSARANEDATRQMGGVLQGEGDTFNSASGDTDLRPSSGYYGAMHDAVTGAQSGVRSALDPSKLSLDLDKNKYIMSDGEVQDIQEQAGRAASLSRTANYEDIQRRALAGGNADPMALAALRSEYDTRAASDAAGGVTSARIAAENAQRDTMMNYGQAKLGADQTAAGLRSSAEMGLGQFGAGVAQESTGTQLSAAQQLAALRSGQAETMANQGIGAAQWTGNNANQNAQNYANLYQNALQYTGTQGTQIQQAQDQAAQQRAAQLYGIRQGNTQYGQQQGFQQNYLTQGQLANLYQNAATARVGGDTNFLNWSTGQNQFNTNAGLQLNQQQIGTANTAFGNMNTATGQWGNYDLGKSGQSFGTAFKQSLGGFLGNPIGSVTGGKGVSGMNGT